MANKWQPSFTNELGKLAQEESSGEPKKKSYWQRFRAGEMGMFPDIGGKSTTDTVKSITGAKEGEGWWPGDQTKPMTMDNNPFMITKDKEETPAVDKADTLTAAPSDTSAVAGSDTSKVVTPEITAAQTDTSAVAGSDTSKADTIIQDIKTNDESSAFVADSSDTTKTETPVGDPKSSVTESQITKEDLTNKIKSSQEKYLTPIANETVTENADSNNSIAADSAPEEAMKPHNDWGQATKSFKASEGAGYGTLSDAIKHRSTLEKGSDEYMAVQGDINRSYGKTNRSSDYYKTMQNEPGYAGGLTPGASSAPSQVIAEDSSAINTKGLGNKDLPQADGTQDGSGKKGEKALQKKSFFEAIKQNRK